MPRGGKQCRSELDHLTILIDMRRVFLVCILTVFTFSSMAQETGSVSLKNDANRGDVTAMFRLGKSYLQSGDESLYSEAYKWLTKASDKGNVQAKALLAYMLKNGIGVQSDPLEAEKLLGVASRANDGLAWWLSAQMAKESGKGDWYIRGFVEKAFSAGYPMARLLFAKYYSVGNLGYDLAKDEIKSRQLLNQCADDGDPDAAALYGIELLRQGSSQAFQYLKRAADGGNSSAMAQVANMYFHGNGVPRDESQAFVYYKMSADKGNLSGIEGLADCYRLGIGTGGVFNERASNLYAGLNEKTPREMFLRGYYLNKGEGVAKDTKLALTLFEEAGQKGNVFAQAYLAIACFEGADPFMEKDNAKSYEYLEAALANKDFGLLPKSIASSVCQYAAACKLYGFGTTEDEAEADRLSERSRELKRLSSSEQVPFGLIGMISPEESLESCSFSWDSEEFANILDKVTLDYPVLEREMDARPEPKTEPETPAVIPSEAKDLPNQQTVAPAPKTQKTKGPKSGRLAVLIEASPYCFAPSSVISSRDNNTYWLKGSAIDLSASVGWLTRSGLFIGGGAGFESFSGSRMSVIQGFVDARYFTGGSDKSGIFLGARGGIGLGAPEYGIGITAAGMLGYKISIGGSAGINIGLKAGINSFTDDNKTMGNVVGPFVGIIF